jgi:hypothetical protein
MTEVGCRLLAHCGGSRQCGKVPAMEVKRTFGGRGPAPLRLTVSDMRSSEFPQRKLTIAPHFVGREFLY